MLTYTCPSGHVVLLDDDVVLPAKVSVGSHGYAQFWDVERQTVVLLHRWLLGLVPGDGLLGDHIDRNVMDCRRENLRVATPTESNLNRVVAARDLPLGVYLSGSRYVARIKRNRKSTNVGTFGTVEEALAARNAALVDH